MDISAAPSTGGQSGHGIGQPAAGEAKLQGDPVLAKA
jgi:hypothetical protein